MSATNLMTTLYAHRTPGNMPVAHAVVDKVAKLADDNGHAKFADCLENIAARLPASETPRPALRGVIVDRGPSGGERVAYDVLNGLAHAASRNGHDRLANALDALATVAQSR